MARRYLLGKRLPLMVEALLDVVEHTCQWLEDRSRDPKKAEAEVHARLHAVTRLRVEQNCSASDAAAEQGRLLLEAKLLHGAVGWPALLESMGIRARTAQNLMAVAVLAKTVPDIYLRFRVLGPTKLYRLSRLGHEALQGLSLDAEVDLPRGRVKVRQLSDRELQAYLRVLVPPRQRPPILRAASHLLTALRLAALPLEAVSPAEMDFVLAGVEQALDRLRAGVLVSPPKDPGDGLPIRRAVG